MVAIKNLNSIPEKRISVAPMMDVTDAYFRVMLRRISNRAWLYTEMVPARAVIEHPDRYLTFFPEENPVVLQLGGSSESELSRAAELAERFGYDEINLNCGCPSDRVSDGGFGACLMLEPEKTAKLVAAIRRSVSIPVSVKHRISTTVDNNETDQVHLNKFVDGILSAGCARLIVHARTAVLGKFSPAENRSIPPLRFDVVEKLKGDYPGVPIEINGGILAPETARDLLKRFDGVMIGRAIVNDPLMLAFADDMDGGHDERHRVSPADIFFFMVDLMEKTDSDRGRKRILHHVMNLFHGKPGARAFRRSISVGLQKDGLESAGQFMRDAYAAMPNRSKDQLELTEKNVRVA